MLLKKEIIHIFFTNIHKKNRPRQTLDGKKKYNIIIYTKIARNQSLWHCL